MSAAGAAAEQRAARFLESRGLALVERNYRCRFGEIDLVMRDGDTLVFVEVRMRSRKDFGGAGESITAAKRGRLARAAGHYLARLKRAPACRFDAVLLEAAEAGPVEWVRNAFDA